MLSHILFFFFNEFMLTYLPQFLLSISADVDHVDDDGNSALHHAAAWGHTHVRF
jgi:ankyrin repeat protein